MSKSLKKMSRPRITFPNLKQVGTRPDQDVQLLETGRQKELFGHKVANAEWKDKKVPNQKFRLSGSNKVLDSKQGAVDAEAGRVGNKFDRNTLGLNYPTKQGPKAAALAGKLRSKFEEADEGDGQKMQAYKQKVSDAAKKYKEDYEKWYEELKQFPPGSTAYYNHAGSRPKYEKPRKPAKSLKATKDLSPEKMKLRGQTVDSTVEHEGFHYLIDQIKNHYGKDAAIKIKQDLISHHHPETLKAIGSWISKTRGYDEKSPSFGEELLTHSRDLLVNPTKREHFKKFINNDEKFKEHIKNLKQSHQKSYEWAQNVRPEDLAGQNKLAASELVKARVDEGKLAADKRQARNERASSWEKENRGMHSGASSNPEVSKFLHNAKLHQIKTNPKPKLDKAQKLPRDVHKELVSKRNTNHKAMLSSKYHEVKNMHDRLMTAKQTEAYKDPEKKKIYDEHISQVSRALAAHPDGKMVKATKLEHYSPKAGLASIDPQYKKTGVDATVKGRDTSHPHSFYYRAGTVPEDRVKQVSVAKYTVEIPETAKIYDLAADHENHIGEAIKANQGALNMDMVHQRLKDHGYEGFYNSAHPHLSNVVALYHAVPTKEESKV